MGSIIDHIGCWQGEDPDLELYFLTYGSTGLLLAKHAVHVWKQL